MHLVPASCRAVTVNYTSTRGITSLFRRAQFWWVRCRYCRIICTGFYSFAHLRIPVIKNDEIYCSASAITTRKDYGSENHSAFAEIRGKDGIWIFIGTVFTRDIPGLEQQYKVCRRSPPRLVSRYKSSAYFLLWSSKSVAEIIVISQARVD